MDVVVSYHVNAVVHLDWAMDVSERIISLKVNLCGSDGVSIHIKTEYISFTITKNQNSVLKGNG